MNHMRSKYTQIISFYNRILFQLDKLKVIFFLEKRFRTYKVIPKLTMKKKIKFIHYGALSLKFERVLRIGTKHKKLFQNILVKDRFLICLTNPFIIKTTFTKFLFTICEN